MSDSGDNPQGEDRGGSDPISDAIHQIFSSIRGNEPQQGPGEKQAAEEQAAAEYAAIVVRGQARGQRTRANDEDAPDQEAPNHAGAHPLAGAAQDMHRAVQQVRSYFLAVASMELRNMLDDALYGPAGGADAFAAGPTTRPERHAIPGPLVEGTVSPRSKAPAPEADETDDEAEPESPPSAKYRGPAQNEDVQEESEEEPETEDAALEEEEAEEEVPDSPSKPVSQASDLFEGTVKLVVMAEGNMQRVVRFVDELCQKPQFRMLRMEGSPQQQGAEIAVGLREPLRVKDIVAQMNNVERVEDAPTDQPDEPAITVFLANS